MVSHWEEVTGHDLNPVSDPKPTLLFHTSNYVALHARLQTDKTRHTSHVAPKYCKANIIHWFIFPNSEMTA